MYLFWFLSFPPGCLSLFFRFDQPRVWSSRNRYNGKIRAVENDNSKEKEKIRRISSPDGYKLDWQKRGRGEGRLEKREANGIGETEGAGTQCLICSWAWKSPVAALGFRNISVIAFLQRRYSITGYPHSSFHPRAPQPCARQPCKPIPFDESLQTRPKTGWWTRAF